MKAGSKLSGSGAALKPIYSLSDMKAYLRENGVRVGDSMNPNNQVRNDPSGIGENSYKYIYRESYYSILGQSGHDKADQLAAVPGVVVTGMSARRDRYNTPTWTIKFKYG